MGQLTGPNYTDERSKLDPLLTFTRASSATRFNAAGVLETVAVNQPRFDFDPVTLLPRGLLIEGQRTNLCLRSEEFTASPWVATGGASLAANVATAPDGSMYADRLTFSAAGELYQYVAATGTVASVWLKGTAGQTTIFCGTLVVFSGAWQRAVAPGAVDGASTYISIQKTAGSTATEMLVWGAQMEVGAHASSYIPTTSTASTRAADVGYTDSLLPWFPQPGTFTLCADVEVTNTSADSAVVAGRLSGSSAPTYLLLYSASKNFSRWPSTAEHDTGLSVLASQKLAMSVDSSGQYRYARNGAVGTQRTDATKVGLQRLNLGNYGESQYFLNGWFRRLQVTPYAVSDLVLKAMSQV